jgi:hypothetical protein
MQGQQTPIRFQDLKTLLRAREIVIQLDNDRLDAAIEVARAALAARSSRRQYMHEILPACVAYTIPYQAETFVVECADGRSFRLQDCTLPLLWQMLHLEQEQGVQVVKVIHDDGRRLWTYSL